MRELPPRYDEVAHYYTEEFDDTFMDAATTAVLALLGELTHERVLDVACGHGRLARELARRGAAVVGIDISSALLDHARRRESDEPLAVEYLEADAASPETLLGERFDRVTCNFGLSDIDDLDGALATISRVLDEAGTFVFSILHPCFPGGSGVSASWPLDGGYFQEGWWRSDAPSSGLRRKVGANHRMLSTYLNALAAHGLTIEEAREPAPARHAPAADAVPTFFAARCRPPQRA